MNITSPRDPRLNRRAINRRWLAATGLMAAAAAFMMIGALDVAFHGKIHFSAAVATFVRSAASQIGASLDGRGDRLDPMQATIAAAPSLVHIGQLSAGDSGDKPLTHVQAQLGPGTPIPAVATVAKRVIPDDEGTAARFTGEPMPQEVMFGGQRRRRAVSESLMGYADAQENPPQIQALNVTVMPEAMSRREQVQKIIITKPRDNLPQLLAAFGVAADDAGAITAKMPGWSTQGPGIFAGGEAVTVVEPPTEEGQAALRPLKVIVQRQGSAPVAVALSDDGSYAVVTAPSVGADLGVAPMAPGSGTTPDIGPQVSVRDNLYALAAANNIDRSLIDQLLRLCAHDVDLDAPASPDDAVDLLYGSNDNDQSELAFVGLTVDGKTHRYYRFAAPDDKSVDYYDQNGHSLTQMLLRKPVASGRLGDGFGWRIHPVLHDRRFHQGVDYAAPYGSPVAAAGAGVVEKIDYESGYGKYIRVKHDQGYETTYAHVSGFPRGVQVGTRVRQGDTIAYIGSTGLSTGPHLYYEVRINGRNVDPLRIRLEAGRLLDGNALNAFRRHREKLDQALAAK